MSNYENAPATQILATHCAACSRPLVDAESVEAGMGPDCRRKYLKPAQLSESARKQANACVYELALIVSRGFSRPTDRALFGVGIDSLKLLGCEKLVEKLEKMQVSIRIEETDGRLCVVFPYDENAVYASRSIPGRCWDKERKVNTFDATDAAKHALWALLRRYFPGRLAKGPKGYFTVK